MAEEFGVNLKAALSRKASPALDPVDEFFSAPLWKRVTRADAEKFVNSYASKIYQA